MNVEPTFTIALAGQPNVGKSTIFNSLTHQNQYVSNWPGKTCEMKSSLYQRDGVCVSIVDLPGIYSLTANSEEERIGREFLIHCRPDVVVAILDASALERSLYLTAELVCLPVPVVVALNRLDVAKSQGIMIEPHVLEAALGVPVVPMVASRDQGMAELIETALRVAKASPERAPNRPEIQADHKAVFDEILQRVIGKTPAPYPPDWVTMKLLEGDAEITGLMQTALGAGWEAVETLLAQHDDAYLAVASGRYEWIGRMVRAAVVRPKLGQLTLTDRIDRLATHPLWGLLILLAALGLLFSLVFVIGAPIQAWLEGYVVRAADWMSIQLSGKSQWLGGLLADGIIIGVGTVLTLLPILILFFAALGLLEDVGYMARAAYVMDRYMHWMGLHGKSFLPLFLGFGCNVPAMMGARIIESPKGRLTTLLVTPLMPCTARLSVIVLLAPVFFGQWAGLVVFGLIGLALFVLAVIGIGLHRFFFRDTQAAFIMELPLYHAPDLRRIGLGVWQRVVDFLKGAGGVILVMSVILWWLSTYPGGHIETSYLAKVGQGMAPLGKLMGLDWRMMVALLTSVVRKENTIPTLAVLFAAGARGMALGDIIGHQLSPAAALAFLAVQILFIPCVATVSTLHQETRSWGWTFFSVVTLFVISMGVGILIYQGATWLGVGV